MEFNYKTERLSLQVLNGSYASDVLYFYKENREIFEQYEAKRVHNFYTEDYQRRVLEFELNLCLNQSSVRFWVFTKTDPSRIIGTVCFRNITRGIYQCCETGYKFDERYWHQGYAAEALTEGIRIVFQELELHRIVAKIMPDNAASIRLIERLGFEWEGIARQCAMIRGKWEDHVIYSLIAP